MKRNHGAAQPRPSDCDSMNGPTEPDSLRRNAFARGRDRGRTQHLDQRIDLRFRDRRRERAFRRYATWTARRGALIVYGVGIALYVAFAIADLAVGGDDLWSLLAIRFGFGVPVTIGAVALIGTRLYFKFPQLILSLPMLVVGASLLAMVAVSEGLAAATYHNGLLLDVVYCAVLLDLFFLNACWVVAVLCAGYGIVAFTATPLPPEHAALNLGFLLSLSVLALAATYLTEARVRTQYMAALQFRETARQAERRRREAAEARAASEARTRLLATMGHEIRNPLTAVVGLARTIAEGHVRSPDRHLDLAARIARNARHTLGIVEDVLEFARSEHGALRARPESHTVGALIDEVRDIVDPLANEAGVRVLVDPMPGTTALHVDPRLTRQALINLASNAVKFAGPRGDIRIGAVDRGERGFRFEVVDSGPGMSPEEAARVFDAFATTDAGRRRGGTGLGLAVVRQIARAHGGDVRCDSRPGEGTAMRLDLPASAVVQRAGASNIAH